MKKRHYYDNDYKPYNKRMKAYGDIAPFFGLLAGVAALVGGLIWLIETFVR